MVNPSVLEPAVQALVEDVARRNNLSVEAINALLLALKSGGYTMAQFNHPDLGGMGQWSGGMTMIGNISDSDLKDRVKSACAEIVAAMKNGNLETQPSKAGHDAHWWPENFGAVTSSGSQNHCDYAYSPSLKQLAIRRHSKVIVYETGAHEIKGVSQQQGASNTLIFESQLGQVTEKDLKPI